jgi:hypothetical protein
MESATFRKWLADRGCRFDHHEHHQRGEGQTMVTVHREGRKTEVPLGGSRGSDHCTADNFRCEPDLVDRAKQLGGIVEVGADKQYIRVMRAKLRD